MCIYILASLTDQKSFKSPSKRRYIILNSPLVTSKSKVHSRVQVCWKIKQSYLLTLKTIGLGYGFIKQFKIMLRARLTLLNFRVNEVPCVIKIKRRTGDVRN